MKTKEFEPVQEGGEVRLNGVEAEYFPEAERRTHQFQINSRPRVSFEGSDIDGRTSVPNPAPGEKGGAWILVGGLLLAITLVVALYVFGPLSAFYVIHVALPATALAVAILIPIYLLIWLFNRKRSGH